MEQPRRFHFAVTWSSLTAELQLREVADRGEATQVLQTQLQEIEVIPAVPVAPQPARKPESESKGRWEMVVPKMVRKGPKTFVPASPFPQLEAMAAAGPSSSPPLFANFGQQPFLSRAFSGIGRRTRALLAGPAQPEAVQASGADEADRQATRELFLSRIARALRNRAQEAGSLFAAHREEERRP